MLAVLRNTVYARLFGAQVIALLGTGLLTIALGLLAFDLAGGDAGIVMGTAMTIKMLAYVGIAPLISALLAHVPRKRLLVSADVVRAAVALCLPFVTEAWQIYALIFLLQSASATFTPAFQALIPSILPEEREYTRALSLSRLAYDLESLVSPMLAAVLLTVLSYHNLFAGTVVGFVGSAVLVAVTRLPVTEPPTSVGFLDRLTGGVRTFWARRELRGLMALNLVVATTTAMVIVNTVVLVKADLERSQADVALMLAANGAGSMVVALGIPWLLDRFCDRRVMFCGAAVLPVALLAGAAVMRWGSGQGQWFALIGIWFLIGAATSTILTPSARLLQRNSDEQTRPGVFAAQFSLSHACFLLTYPLAGTLGAVFGLPATATVLVGIGLLGAVLAFATWRTPPGAEPGWPAATRPAARKGR
ncbi:MFS transporter [Paeniglutamicibacter sulfureus]|uniref:MFS family permease n=1 Tax=Paeniglutamicibacter sulfureus TaxID=43666 RepID=A0ABU2BNG1_9MICC|nr:MFS transporter [Paeniglutamicibacter sulfureus]MDO2935177.1 MFS transporter [Paeniglutamicibacter sulfureus]MDR7359489.1 MFS family permease [Paeniglutamicibacter sulfureus]